MKRRGQTLLELVIASGIIATSIVSSITIMRKTVDLGFSSRNKIEATNYAREGLEVIRMIRDSNWLKIDSNVEDRTSATPPSPTLLTRWNDSGLSDDGWQSLAGNYVLVFSPAAGWSAIKCTGVGNTCTPSEQLIWIDNTGGLSYARQNCPGACGTKTGYDRTIAISSLTDSITIGGNGYSPAYLDVTSTVRWRSGSGAPTTKLRTRLYNWR